MIDEIDSSLEFRVGERIRQQRKTLGLSLQDLARSTSLSVGVLSQIERGISSPSVRALLLISRALDAQPGDFFKESEKSYSNTEIIVSESDRRVVHYSQGVKKELLSPPGLAGVELYLVTMTPGATSGADYYSHTGTESGHVLAGELRLFVEGDQFDLRRGDSFGFRSDLRHKFSNPGKSEATVLWALSGPMIV
jgi:transcriptional regulator with XRE-family HTH domain